MIAAQWQIFTWFSTARFLAFVLVEVVHVLSDSRDYVVPFLLANDILLCVLQFSSLTCSQECYHCCRLTWDVVTSGVWFATVVWQMVVAFVATAWVSFRLFTDGNVLSRGSGEFVCSSFSEKDCCILMCIQSPQGTIEVLGLPFCFLCFIPCLFSSTSTFYSY